MKISLSNDARNIRWPESYTNHSNANLMFTKSHNDRINISNQSRQLFNGMKNGKQNSMIEGLMKQREALIERRSNLTEHMINSGQDLSGFKEQLKEFEKQIAEIDAAIAKQQIEERNMILGSNGNEDAKTSPDSEEEKLLNQAVTLDQVKTLDSVFNRLEREKNTLKIEIKLDASRGANIEGKQDKINKIEDKLQTIQGQFNEIVGHQLKNDESIENEENINEKKSVTYDKLGEIS
ncbi:hypothetical protein [Fredinandcohnia quinoae]|uniref:FlxA-like protein n=1 Tax=Fredinandcohnia quinoae TaxID=2918902 RepID=A0AAW5E618_9BACI|nr:hypothetical protein [Fredinandcohnia sp. SECRCQ15]MCH1625060.1 hypothetical protein [Fredinandcohnia sp. SECRCQ15]